MNPDALLGGSREFEVFLSSLNVLSFIRECILFVVKATQDKSHGLGDVGSGGFLLGIRGQKHSCTYKGKADAAGSLWGGGTHTASAQPRPCRRPTAQRETQLHRSGETEVQDSWPPVWGHPPNKG